MFIRYRLLNRLVGRIKLSEGQTQTKKVCLWQAACQT